MRFVDWLFWAALALVWFAAQKLSERAQRAAYAVLGALLVVIAILGIIGVVRP